MSIIAYQVFPPKLQNLWAEWNLRIAVLISLFFQVILIFFAPARKRSGNMLIQVVIWAFYLLADWIAAFAVGQISTSQGDKQEKAAINNGLAAFWAPFLLLHLGGPDTITAFSLEDNELWLRHMLGVVIQVLAVGYVIILSFPNQFWLPTALIFLAGTIKYAERTRALYLACLGKLRDFLPKPDFDDIQVVVQQIRFEVIDEVPEHEQEHKEVILQAYRFYNIFRGVIVDHIFNRESRMFFLSLKAQDAFKIMEVELNFMYDALYTKMAMVHHGLLWYVLRFICSSLLVAAFVLFTSHHKPSIHQIDMVVTYALLVGAVILDFVALVKLIFCDWTIALMLTANQPLLRNLNVTSTVLAIHKVIPFRKRWSNDLYQLNFITYCLQKRYEIVDKIAELFALETFLDKLWYERKQNLDDGLKNFIFSELKLKADSAEKIAEKDPFSAKGDDIMRSYGCPQPIQEFMSDITYGFTVLVWHIATEICFYHDKITKNENRTRSKQLSDYLLYLFMLQPKLMMSVAGGADIRFQEICEEARNLFNNSGLQSTETDAVEKLINVKAEKRSLLSEISCLASDLKEKVDTDPQRTWEMISKVWVELLCYSASHCGGHAHAQQLRQGGELLTFVWLIMEHLGFGFHRAVHFRN